jgi:hypothetical protein
VNDIHNTDDGDREGLRNEILLRVVKDFKLTLSSSKSKTEVLKEKYFHCKAHVSSIFILYFLQFSRCSYVGKFFNALYLSWEIPVI